MAPDTADLSVLFSAIEETHIVERLDVERNIYVRHDPPSFVLYRHPWQMKTKEEICGCADAPVATKSDFGVPMKLEMRC